MNDEIHYHFGEGHGRPPFHTDRFDPCHHRKPPRPADFNVETGVVLQGDEGLSAYEVALKNGFIGSEEEWLDSLRGKDGYPKTLKATIKLEGTEAKVEIERKDEENLVTFHFTLPEKYLPEGDSGSGDSGGNTGSTGSTGLGMGLGMGLGSTYHGGN